MTADIGGQTLAPGVYTTTSAQPSLAITGNLTLAGTGVYIFQVISTLTTAAGSSSVPASQVILSGGATCPRYILASRQFSDAWHFFEIFRNHHGLSLHHRYEWSNDKWQVAGPYRHRHIEQQSNYCAGLPMRQSAKRILKQATKWQAGIA